MYFVQALLLFTIPVQAAGLSLGASDRNPPRNSTRTITRRAGRVYPAVINAPDATSSETVSDTEVRADKITIELLALEFGYLASFQVGSPPNEYDLLIDTGSADTWIKYSEDEYRRGGIYYNPDDSDTSHRFLESADAVHTIGYAGDLVGQTEFVMWKDTMTTDGLKVIDVPIGVARRWSDMFEPAREFYGSGVLGLGPHRLSVSGKTPFFHVLWERGLIPSPFFSIRLIHPHWADNTDDKSVLTLGGIDPEVVESQFLNMRVLDEAEWIVQLNSIYVEGSDGAIGAIPARIDVGCYSIIGELEGVRALFRAVVGYEEGAQSSNGMHVFTVPCDSKDVITLVFGRWSFRLSFSQLIGRQVSDTHCMSGFVGVAGRGDIWTLGQVFMRSVYTMFTFSPQHPYRPYAVSFAKVKEPEWLPGLSPTDLSDNSDQSVYRASSL